MNGPMLLDMDLGSRGAHVSSHTSKGAMQRAALLGTPPDEMSNPGGQIAPTQTRIFRARSDQALGSLSEQFVQNLAVFPKSGGVIHNQYGVYVPGTVLGQNAEVTHEIDRSTSGIVRVTITAYPSRQEHSDPVTLVDCGAELRWLAEHRNEYAGQWVALDGDRLIAAGREARQVYEVVRQSGVDLPLVTQVEPADELPFGGW